MEIENQVKMHFQQFYSFISTTSIIIQVLNERP